MREKHSHESDEFVRFVAISATPTAITTREVEEASEKDPLPLPDGPWQDLAVDLLGPLPSKHSILVVVNYYSRFYENGILTSTTTSNMIDSLKGIFSRHGLPTTLKSDNGPQFRSDEGNGIKHLKTTPKWAQANGKVECQNASIMKRIRIVQLEGLDWQSNSGSMLQCTEESCITQQIKARLNFCSKGIWEARYLNSNLWMRISKFMTMMLRKREIQTVGRWSSQSRILKCRCWRSGFNQTGQDQ